MACVEIFKQLLAGEKLPVSCASVAVTLRGGPRGDADNLAGACLDVLLDAGVIEDDLLSCGGSDMSQSLYLSLL